MLIQAKIPAVTVTVDAGTAVRTLTNELFGQNMSVYDSTALSSNGGYTSAVAAMGATQMRFPGGGYADLVDWNNIECSGSQTWMINIQEAIAFANAGSATSPGAPGSTAMSGSMPRSSIERPEGVTRRVVVRLSTP